jgi:hypothetical protein
MKTILLGFISYMFVTVLNASEIDSPSERFTAAHKNFLKRDTEAAAREIRNAAVMLARESDKTAGAGKKDLRALAAELEMLAEQVGKGTVAGAEELTVPFGRACRAMAESHAARSSEAWSKREAHRAGEELRAASDDLAAAATWTGHEGDYGVAAAVQGARATGSKLTKGAKWTEAEVRRSMDDVDRELKGLERARSSCLD